MIWVVTGSRSSTHPVKDVVGCIERVDNLVIHLVTFLVGTLPSTAWTAPSRRVRVWPMHWTTGSKVSKGRPRQVVLSLRYRPYTPDHASQ